jgi:hypothetical protein
MTWAKLVTLFGAIVVLIGALWGINYWRLTHQKVNPSTTPPATPAAAEQALTYSITVQKYRDNKPFEAPFQLAKEMLFERDYQIRLNVSSAQSGFLYILNEGPHEKGQPGEFVVLFPSPTSNSGSALISENQPIQIPEKSWIKFDQERGTERVWLVFSRSALPELEPARSFASVKSQGLITDTAVRDRVQMFLRTHAEEKSSITQNAEQKETRISNREEVLVHAIDLEHQ